MTTEIFLSALMFVYVTMACGRNLLMKKKKKKHNLHFFFLGEYSINYLFEKGLMYFLIIVTENKWIPWGHKSFSTLHPSISIFQHILTKSLKKNAF